MNTPKQTVAADIGIGMSLGILAGFAAGSEYAEMIPHAIMVEHCRAGVAAELHQTLDDMVRILSTTETSDPILDFVLERKLAMALGSIQGAIAGAVAGVVHVVGQKVTPINR